MEIVTLEIFRNKVIQMVFIFFWSKWLHDGEPFSEADIGQYLPTESPLADRVVDAS